MRKVWVFTVWDSKKTYLLYGGVGEIFFSHRKHKAEKLYSLCARVGKKKFLLFVT